MVDFGSASKDRWVCPNDRQLALRAKLKTGWSVKTGTLQGYHQQHVNTTLNDSEQQVIKDVIKRAEVLELTEQERVGKLVDRLDTMKKNAVGNGTSQCVLCGDHFGMLGAPSLLCHDCKKLVCGKCGIDTFTAHKEPIALCKICSETREMWKKSGAWFFKGLPKYTLPAKKPTEMGKYGARRIQRPGVDKNNWSKPSPIASKVSEEEESSSDDDLVRRQVRVRPSVDEPDAPPRAVKLVTFDLSTVRSESTHDVRDVACGDREGDGDHKPGSKECHRHEDLSGSSLSLTSTYSSHYQRTDSSGSHADSDSLHSQRAASPFRPDQTNHSGRSVSPYRLPHSRRDSQMSQVSRDWSGSEDRLSVASGSGNSVTNMSVEMDDQQANPQDNNAQLGTLELSLLYDPMSMVLHCSLHRAKGLKAMDINGLADPFCRINLLPNEGKSNRLRTKTVHKTRNPEFNETLTFYGVTEQDMARKMLHIQILDDDKFGTDFMGEACITLSHVRPEISRYMNVFLEHRNPALATHEETDLTRGQILVTLCYSTRKRALVVTINRCVNLTPMDNNGLSDPFVKLRLKPDTHRRKYKTSVKWKNLNPTFNEEFVFDTKMTDLPRQALELTVWDKDYGKSNDYLGGLQLGWNSKGDRLRHWVDMIKFPDHKHEGWHYLGEHLLPE